MKNIPNLDALFNEVVAYVKEHQGEKGYIDCQPYPKDSASMGDTIYGIIYDDFYEAVVEKYVYAVRVVNDDLEVLLENITRYYTVYEPEDFTDELNEDKWHSVRWSDVYYVPTLFNIAEVIEEYA